METDSTDLKTMRAETAARILAALLVSEHQIMKARRDPRAAIAVQEHLVACAVVHADALLRELGETVKMVLLPCALNTPPTPRTETIAVSPAHVAVVTPEQNGRQSLLVLSSGLAYAILMPPGEVVKLLGGVSNPGAIP